MDLHAARFSLSHASVSPLQLLTTSFSGLVDSPFPQNGGGGVGAWATSPLQARNLGENSFLSLLDAKANLDPTSLERGGTGQKEERAAVRSD